MALITLSQRDIRAAGASEFVADSRFRAWAKLIASPSHVDLQRRNGFALTSAFIDWGTTVAVPEGAFLLVAAQAGTRRDHPYNYALLRAEGDTLRAIPASDIDAYVRSALIPDDVRAAALNSFLYAVAVYAMAHLPQADASAGEHERLRAARVALAALSPEERAQLLAELSHAR